MTDDEIRQYLKPRHDWLKIGVAVAALLGAAWGVAKWAATSPTPEKVERIQNDVVQVRLDIATMQGDVRAMQGSIERIEKSQAKTEAEPQRRRRGDRER